MLVLQKIKLTYAHIYVFFCCYHINQNNKVVVCKYIIQFLVQELSSFLLWEVAQGEYELG